MALAALEMGPAEAQWTALEPGLILAEGRSPRVKLARSMEAAGLTPALEHSPQLVGLPPHLYWCLLLPPSLIAGSSRQFVGLISPYKLKVISTVLSKIRGDERSSRSKSVQLVAERRHNTRSGGLGRVNHLSP